MDLKTAPGKPLPSLKDERRFNSQAVSPQILGERSKPNDVGSQNTMAKVEVSTTRPCAVIEPDRIIPQPAHKNESYMEQQRSDTWPYSDNTYNKYGAATTKPAIDSHMPPRNISPRQTFQENMQRFMTQPRLDILKGNDPAAIVQSDKTVNSLKNVRVNPSMDPKYCDVPYVVNPLQSDHRARMIRNGDLYTSGIPQGVIPSQPHWSSTPVQVNPYAAYGPPELNRYQEYTTCALPRTSVVSHQPRGPPEEPTAYPESYFRGGDVRYEPYPTSKDKYPRTRYDYVSNYATPCPPYYHPPKYDIPKNLTLPTYVGYNHTPYKYTDPRMVDYGPEPYSRQPQFPNYPDPAQAKYSASTGNVQNKMCSYPIDSNQLSNTKAPYNTNRIYSEYESNRFKVPVQEAPYLSSEMQHYQIKPQVPIHNHMNSDNMKPPPYAYYYRNDGPMVRNIGPSYPSRYRNYDPSQFGCHNPLAKIPIQFSPNVISPSGSNTSNDSMLTHSTSQEDYGYVSQCSTASGKSVDSTYPYPSDVYRKSDRLHFNPNMQSTIHRNLDVKEKPVSKTLKDKNLDVRQFLQMWDEEFEEVASIHKAPSAESDRLTGNSKQEQLYVLGMVNVSSEELQKYEHIQKVSKLPENIKGYDNVELLRQFDAVFGPKQSPSIQTQDHKKPKILQSLNTMPERPISPLDVEAKISQSVIHKEVGCNFEIKPCSPSKVDITRPQMPISVLSERRIERVLNCQDTIIKPITDLEMKKSADKRKILQNLEDTPNPKIKRVSDCKVVNSIKPEFISKEYQNISSVGLDSLPRLDTELDLNFQEVNQQFVNSQSSCHIVEKKSSAKVVVLPFNDTNIDIADSAAQDLQHYNDAHAKETNKTKCVSLSNPLQRTDTVIKKNLPVSKEYLGNQSPNNHLSNQPSNEPFDHESLLYNFNGFQSPSISQIDNHLSPMNLTSDSANYLPECVNEMGKNSEERPIPKCESFSDSISINVAINLSIHSNNPDLYNTNGIQSIQSSNTSGVTSERHLQDNNSLEPYLNEVSCTITPCEDTINEINLPVLESGPKNDNAIKISTHHEIDFGSIITNNDTINNRQLDLVPVKNENTLPNDSEDISDMHKFESSDGSVRKDVKSNENECEGKSLLKTDLEERISASCLYILNTECSFTRIHVNKNYSESSEKSRHLEYYISHRKTSSEDPKTVGMANQQVDAHPDHTDSIMSSQKKRHFKAPRSVECIFDSISGKIILKTGKKISSQKRRNAVNESGLSKEVAHHETKTLSLLSSDRLDLKGSLSKEEHLFIENVSSDNSHSLHANDTVKVIEKHGDDFNHKADLLSLQAASTTLPDIKASNRMNESNNRETDGDIDICKQHYDGISTIAPETIVPKSNFTQQSFEVSHQTIDCLINDFDEHDSLCSNLRHSTMIPSPHKTSALEINGKIDPVVRNPTIDKDVTLDMSVSDGSNGTNIITPNNVQDYTALPNLGIFDLPKMKSMTDEKAQPHELFPQKTQGHPIIITDSSNMESKKSIQTLQNFKPKQAIKKIKLKAKKIKGTFKDKKLNKTNSIVIKKELGHLKLKLSLRGIKRTSSFRSKKPRKKKYYIVNENTLHEDNESLVRREKSTGKETNQNSSEIPKDIENIFLVSPQIEHSIESFVPSDSLTPKTTSQSQSFINENVLIKHINIKDEEKDIFCTTENDVLQYLAPERNSQQMREVTSETSTNINIPSSKGELSHQNDSCTNVDIISTTTPSVTCYIENNTIETCGTKSSLNEDSDETQSEPKNTDSLMTGDNLESPVVSNRILCHNLTNPSSPKEILSKNISENTQKYNKILPFVDKNTPEKPDLKKENNSQELFEESNQYDLQSITEVIKQDDSCLHRQMNTVKFEASNDLAEGVKNIFEYGSRYLDNSSNQCSSDNTKTTENPPAQCLTTLKSEIPKTKKANIVSEKITIASIEKSKDQEEINIVNVENVVNNSSLQDSIENIALQSAITRPIDAKEFCNSMSTPIETYNVETKCESFKEPLKQLSPQFSKIENNSKEILSNNIVANNIEIVTSNNPNNKGKSILIEIESNDMDRGYGQIKPKKSDPWQEETLHGNIIDSVASSNNIKLETCEPSDYAIKKNLIDCAVEEINTELACFKNTAIKSIQNITTRCEDSEIYFSGLEGPFSVEIIKKEEPEALEDCLSYYPKNETNNDNKKSFDSSDAVIIEKKEPKVKEPCQEDILTETQNFRDAKCILQTNKNEQNNSILAKDLKTNATESFLLSTVVFPHKESKFSDIMKHENTCELLRNELKDCTYNCFLDEVDNGDVDKHKDIKTISNEDGDKNNSSHLATLPYETINNESKIPQTIAPEKHKDIKTIISEDGDKNNSSNLATVPYETINNESKIPQILEPEKHKDIKTIIGEVGDKNDSSHLATLPYETINNESKIPQTIAPEKHKDIKTIISEDGDKNNSSNLAAVPYETINNESKIPQILELEKHKDIKTIIGEVGDKNNSSHLATLPYETINNESKIPQTIAPEKHKDIKTIISEDGDKNNSSNLAAVPYETINNESKIPQILVPEKHKDIKTIIGEVGDKNDSSHLATLPYETINNESKIPQILVPEKHKGIKTIISEDGDKNNSSNLAAVPYETINNEFKIPQILGPEDVFKNDTSSSLDCLFSIAKTERNNSSNTEIASNRMSPPVKSVSYDENSKTQRKENTVRTTTDNKYDSLDISSHECKPCVPNMKNKQEIILSPRNPGNPNDVRKKQDVKQTNSSSDKDQRTEDTSIKSFAALDVTKTINSQKYTPKPFTENNIGNKMGRTTVSSLTNDNNQFLLKSSNLETGKISSADDSFQDTQSVKTLTNIRNCNTMDLIVVSTQSEGQPTGNSLKNGGSLANSSLLHTDMSRTSEKPHTENKTLYQNIPDSENNGAISNDVLVKYDLNAPESTNLKEKFPENKHYSNIYIKCSSDARSEPEDHISYDNSLARLAHDYPSPVETIENEKFVNDCNELSIEKNESVVNFDILNKEKLLIHSTSTCTQIQKVELDVKGLSSLKISIRPESSTLLTEHDINSEDTTEKIFKCDSLIGLVHNYKSPLYEFSSDSIDHQTVANKLYNELWSSFTYNESLEEKFQSVTDEFNFNSTNEVMKTNIDNCKDNDYLSKDIPSIKINENVDEIEGIDSERPAQDVSKPDMYDTFNTSINMLSEVPQYPVSYENCGNFPNHPITTVSKICCVSCFENPQLDSFESSLHKENFDEIKFSRLRSKEESIAKQSENYRADTQHYNEFDNFRDSDNENPGFKERQHYITINENENINHIKDQILPKEKKNKSKKPSKGSDLLTNPEGIRGNSKEILVCDDTLDGNEDSEIALRPNVQRVHETEQYADISTSELISDSKIDKSNYLLVEDITNIDLVENEEESSIQKSISNYHNNDFVIRTESNLENDHVVLTCDTNNFDSTKLKVDENEQNVSYSDINFTISNFVASDVEPDEILNMNTISKEICLESEYIVADALEIHESEDSIITDGLCFLYHDDSEVVLSSESTGCTSEITENSNFEYSYNNQNETCDSVQISPDIWIDDIACVETVVTEGSNIDNIDMYDLCSSPKEFSNKSSEANKHCEFRKKTGDFEPIESISSHARSDDEFAQNCLENSQNYGNTYSKKTNVHSKPKTLQAPGSVFAINTVQDNNGQSRLRCKFTEKSHYSSNIRNYPFSNNSNTVKPLITKAAQKYIPPLSVSPNDLKVSLELPKEMLKQLRENKERKIKSMTEPCSVIERNIYDSINKRNKPKFEDVLKNIDEFQCKILKTKKKRHTLQNVVTNNVKSCSGQEEKLDNNKESDSEQSVEGRKGSPDLTGFKWQPWVFLEKNSMIEKMVLGMKTSAIYCTKRNQIIFSGSIKSRRKSVPATFKSKNREPLKYSSLYSRPL